MTQAEFLEIFQEILQRDEALTVGARLKEIEEWDSLAYMATIAFFDRNFGKRLAFEELTPCQTVADLVALSDGGIV